MKVVIIALCLCATVTADNLIWGENEPHIHNDWEAPPPTEEAPKPCCTPSQWEGNIGEFTAYYSMRHHHPGIAVLWGRLSYDAKNKKVAATVQVPKRPPVKIILDYSQNKTYLIFNSTQHCKVAKTRRPFMPACIPKDAKYLGTFYQGAGGAKLAENAWAARVRGFSLTTSVTKTGCIPVGENVFGHARGTLVASSVGYVNITPGIKNPKVFTPPSYCKSVDEEDLNVGEEYPILEFLKSKFQEE